MTRTAQVEVRSGRVSRPCPEAADVTADTAGAGDAGGAADAAGAQRGARAAELHLPQLGVLKRGAASAWDQGPNTPPLLRLTLSTFCVLPWVLDLHDYRVPMTKSANVELKSGGV